MKYLTLVIVLLVLAIASPAQVTITNTGFATQSGPAFPATPVSPPVMYAPIVRLDQGMTQPIQATAVSNGVVPAPVAVVSQPQSAPAVSISNPGTSEPQPFNFGVAQFGRGTGQGAVGQDINGKSLAEIARDLKHTNAINARTFTNNDISNLSQSGGVSGAVTASGKADNWSPDNGVINPEGQPQPSSVGAPQQTNPDNAQPRSPFAPRSQSYNPAGIDTISNEAVAQSTTENPSAQQPVLMAQNNEPAPPQDQNGTTASQADTDQNSPAQGTNNSGQLPRTASKLPMIGILGLFTVCAGIFVRYQRAKAR